MQNNESNTSYGRIGELILLAASKGVLKKAVLSKAEDPQTVRASVTLRALGGRNVLQAETLRSDHKALHENVETENALRLLEICTAFSQINLLTSVGVCEVTAENRMTLL